jgi:Ca2+-binding EF-hand superfamily protein
MQRFVQLNKAQDGNAMDSTEMHLLWNAIDADSSGCMDYREFVAAFSEKQEEEAVINRLIV